MIRAIHVAAIASSLFLPIRPASGQRQPSLFPGATYPVANYPSAVAIGDLNRDGQPDLVTANLYSNCVSVLLGNELVGFGSATNFTVGTQRPVSVAIGDLNGDGNPDLVTANQSIYVSVLLGNGLGGFGGATIFTVGSLPQSVALGDVNRDGKLDLVTANSSSNNVSVLFGNGMGGFGSATYFVAGTFPVSVSIGDLNGDGRPDVATANRDSSDASVLLGDGLGSFASAASFVVGSHPVSIAIGDLNGDEKPDLVTANRDSGNISVLLGNGIGNFGSATNFVVGTHPVSVAIGDFNQDGRSDLVAAISPAYETAKTGDASVLLGNGLGGFGGAKIFAVGANPASVAVADTNGDGRPDVVTANYSSNDVSVLLGNRLGGLGSAANFPTGGGTYPYAIAIGDLNRDGKADAVTANRDSSNVSVLLGDGLGGFGNATPFEQDCWSLSVAIGDLNEDGNPDLVTISDCGISVLLGNGQGSFGGAANFPLAVGANPQSVAIGDFNGDTKLDVVTANLGANTVSVLLGNGMGGFGSPTNSAVGTSPVWVAIGHLNGDTNLDVVTANAGSNNVSVLFGNGVGGFGGATNISVGTGSYPYSVAVGDLNGDGWPDLVTANYSTDVSVLLGNGMGGFGSLTKYSVGMGVYPYSVAIGDLDGDSNPDLVTANYFSDNIAVLLGNGLGSFGAPIYFALGATPRMVAIIDLNGDGRSDIVTASSYSDNVSVTLNEHDTSHGRVVLGSTSIPMAGVHVEAVDPLNPATVVDGTLTLSDGRFQFHSIPDGFWIIRASVTYSVAGLTTISNYPDSDSRRFWKFTNGQPAQRIDDIRFPDPVVLQGGLWANQGTTWDVALEYLREDPAVDPEKRQHTVPAFLCYPVNGYDDDASEVNDLDANAQLLASVIDAISLAPWIASNDRPKVDFAVIGHSMGGLITRAMVTQHSPTSAVRRIVNLDTPHGGSIWASNGIWNLPALSEQPLNGTRFVSGGAGFSLPAWNASHIELPNTGRVWMLYSEETIINSPDVVYPNASAFGWGRPYYGYPALPDNAAPTRFAQGWEVTDYHNVHWTIHSDRALLSECALFIARGTLPPHIHAPPAPHAPLPVLSDPTQGLGTLAGTLTVNAGGAATQQLHFDSNDIVYGRIVRRGGSAVYSLIDSAGSSLRQVNVQTDLITSLDSLDGFELIAPPTGTINLMLTPGASTAELRYAFYFGDGRKLVVTASPVSLSAGSSTQVQTYLAALDGNVILGNNSNFSAMIRLPGGNSQALTLFDDGAHGDAAANDGIFGASIGGSTTGIAGRYNVHAYGMQDFGAYAVERTGDAEFVVIPTGAAFYGGMIQSTADVDGNGLFDSLRLNQTVSLTSNGSYSLMGDLKDTLGDTFAILSSKYDNTQGSGLATLQLSISGPDLTRHGVNGPWTLSNIRLIRIDAGSLPIMTAPDYVTQAHLLSAFDWPPPPHIAALTPSEGLPGGGQQVVLMGSSLVGATSVLVHGQPATFAVQDDESLLVTIPRMREFIPAAPQARYRSGKGNSPYPIYADVSVTTPWGHDFAPHAFAYIR